MVYDGSIHEWFSLNQTIFVFAELRNRRASALDRIRAHHFVFLVVFRLYPHKHPLGVYVCATEKCGNVIVWHKIYIPITRWNNIMIDAPSNICASAYLPLNCEFAVLHIHGISIPNGRRASSSSLLRWRFPGIRPKITFRHPSSCAYAHKSI